MICGVLSKLAKANSQDGAKLWAGGVCILFKVRWSIFSYIVGAQMLTGKGRIMDRWNGKGEYVLQNFLHKKDHSLKEWNRFYAEAVIYGRDTLRKEVSRAEKVFTALQTQFPLYSNCNMQQVRQTFRVNQN